MIFVEFGNSPCPFPRLAAAIEKLAGDTGEEIIAQSGCTDFEFKHVKAVPFMSQDVFKYHLSSCDIAVLQGGWGGVAEASCLGCRIVAVPRIKGVEHYHDQVQLIKALEEQDVLLGCYDISLLPEIIKKARTFKFKPIVRGDASALINDFIASI